jgi:hypothetical protein
MPRWISVNLNDEGALSVALIYACDGGGVDQADSKIEVHKKNYTLVVPRICVSRILLYHLLTNVHLVLGPIEQ